VVAIVEDLDAGLDETDRDLLEPVEFFRPRRAQDGLADGRFLFDRRKEHHAPAAARPQKLPAIDARFRVIFERTVSVVFLLSIPMALGGLILGTPIMQFVFGAAYGSGGLSFQILMLTLLFDFPIAVISTAIFAYDRQKSLIVASAIAGVFNTALDIALIPVFGIAGSAVATLVAQALTNWYLWHKMRQINRIEILPRLGKIIAASLGMAVVVGVLFLLHVNLLLTIALGVLAYALLLYIFREPLIFELKNILTPAAEPASV
jgi:O-antigen/teichoic acid export membrane protein